MMTDFNEQLQERMIHYHTITLGPLTRQGHATAEVTIEKEAEEPRLLQLLVPAGLPGERVTIAVEDPPTPRPGRRSRRWKPRPPRVWITEIHESSPERVVAPCPVFGTCGGCQLQHLQYERQLTWKREMVGELLREIGHFEQPPLLETVACEIPWNYRNQMRFSINREGQPGLTARDTRRVLPLVSCPIAHERINRALTVLSQFENPRPQVIVRYGVGTGQMLLQPQQPEEVQQQLQEAGLTICDETIEEKLGGKIFRIRPSSFFQTNTPQAEKMVRMVLDGLLAHRPAEKDPAQLTIVDAYCGVGTFALLMAHHFGRIIAIEESPSAIRDAHWNTRDTNNIEILKGKVEDVLPGLSAQVDGFVIDPPRAGCQPVVLETLLRYPVERVVYVSCEPSTLARDLDVLCHGDETYQLVSVQPLDMFPQTAHIECVAVLERNKHENI
ncbi:class I SAM-dependent RNA methyltransferase [Ktedonobacter racemifer]|uniref:RNA methyltransferase, TrmA family n=1 Tax=Ktedonobacter racemifer DSM 44963 TaxID=485913 RepID=D6TJL1_KTERA|nr:class I SAM-dependent RNA methyltransferase [Ktedonobacter racemifer]EFH89618.1 RNA methyltransferase, TrmA family [Ktedonobacter racemifer DSM 44963]